jgi:hypothetical protein
MPSKEEDLEHLNQPLTQREKMKNDAVAHIRPTYDYNRRLHIMIEITKSNESNEV